MPAAAAMATASARRLATAMSVASARSVRPMHHVIHRVRACVVECVAVVHLAMEDVLAAHAVAVPRAMKIAPPAQAAAAAAPNLADPTAPLAIPT